MKTTRTTAIAWTHHTINFWWGCTKVSPACKHCYAEELGRRFGPLHFGTPVIWGDMRSRQERLQAARAEALKLNAKAEKAGERPLIFVNSMSDWLDDQVPVEWLAFLLETIFLCPNLDFQLLTKRPENWAPRVEATLKHLESAPDWDCLPNADPRVKLRNFLANWFVLKSPPPNVWIGTTVENQEWADKRLPHLLRIPAVVRFLSCEPLVGPMDLVSAGALWSDLNGDIRPSYQRPGQHVDWVITGGESGGKAEPSRPDWFRSLRDQCAAAGVPFFFKQWGEWLPQDHTQAAGATAKSYKGQHLPEGGPLMLRVGTKLAGHLLDGQPHQAFPVIP